MSTEEVPKNKNPDTESASEQQQDQEQSAASPSAAATTDANQINGKPIVEAKITGVVKWFNVKSGYGFITRDDNKDDIFVHQTAISRNNPKKYLRSVDDGEPVEFAIVQGEKGLEAVNVTGPNGENVRGSKYAADRREPRSRDDGRGGLGLGFGRGRGRGRGGRRPGRGRGGPYGGRDQMQPGFFPPAFNNYGQPPMMPPPPFPGQPRDYPGPIIRGGRGGRPPFPGGFPFNPGFDGRGRFFRGRGGPVMGGPMGPPMGPPMGHPMGGGYRGGPGRGRGRVFGRGFYRGRPFRGGRGGFRGNSNNPDDQDEHQYGGQDEGQSAV